MVIADFGWGPTALLVVESLPGGTTCLYPAPSCEPTIGLVWVPDEYVIRFVCPD